jgi:hypothetical protein
MLKCKLENLNKFNNNNKFIRILMLNKPLKILRFNKELFNNNNFNNSQITLSNKFNLKYNKFNNLKSKQLKLLRNNNQ